MTKYLTLVITGDYANFLDTYKVDGKIKLKTTSIVFPSKFVVGKDNETGEEFFESRIFVEGEGFTEEDAAYLSDISLSSGITDMVIQEI